MSTDLDGYQDPHERARLRLMGIADCTLCNDDGYRNGSIVCDHVDRTETHKRGIALVREAMKGKLSGNPTVDDPEPEL